MSRSFVLALGTLFLASSFSYAQEAKEPDKKEPILIPRGILPRNWKKLGLSPAQADKIRDVRGLYRYKRAQLEKQIAELRKEELKELIKLLTDAQKVRLKEIMPGVEIPETKTPPTQPIEKPSPPAKPSDGK
jgi:hypothetical protein